MTSDTKTYHVVIVRTSDGDFIALQKLWKDKARAYNQSVKAIPNGSSVIGVYPLRLDVVVEQDKD